MFKITLLLVCLAVAGASAQNEAASAAAEPYSYGYETESHGASESRDPNGKVTGYYNIVDADGRQRRVEYFADESGFHAKVQTNEVGTAQANSADVEVLASPPNQEQFVAYSQAAPAPVPAGVPKQNAFQQQRFASQQVVGGVLGAAAGAPPQVSTTGYQGYAYQPGYAYQSGSVYQPGNAYQAGSAYQSGSAYQPGNAYQAGYAYQPGYAYGSNYGYGISASPQPAVAGSYGGYSSGARYSSYNNHLPSQYYKSVQTGVAQPSVYSTGVGGGQVSRYSSYQSGVPVVGQYAAVPATGGSYKSSSVRTVSSSGGSPNYLVLKK